MSSERDFSQDTVMVIAGLLCTFILMASLGAVLKVASPHIVNASNEFDKTISEKYKINFGTARVADKERL